MSWGENYGKKPGKPIIKHIVQAIKGTKDVILTCLTNKAKSDSGMT